MPSLLPGRMPAKRPGYTPHVVIDLEQGLVAGSAVLVNGHKFFVQRANFDTHGELVHTVHGVESVTRTVGEIELRLVHADWAGCPAVEPELAGEASPDA